MRAAVERMARSIFHRILLAALLLALGAATAPDPEAAYRGAREAYDRGDWKTTLSRIDAALEQFGNRDDDAVWRLRILRASTLIPLGRPSDAVLDASRPLPPRLRNTDTDAERLIAVSMGLYRTARYNEAVKAIDAARGVARRSAPQRRPQVLQSRESTRLNSSHVSTSYAVFCMKKKRSELICRCQQRKLPPPHRAHLQQPISV